MPQPSSIPGTIPALMAEPSSTHTIAGRPGPGSPTWMEMTLDTLFLKLQEQKSDSVSRTKYFLRNVCEPSLFHSHDAAMWHLSNEEQVHGDEGEQTLGFCMGSNLSKVWPEIAMPSISFLLSLSSNTKLPH